MGTAVQDRQFLNLLAHLKKPVPNIPEETLRTALPHYLSTLPNHTLTPFVANIIGANVWLPASVASCSTLSLIFTQAVDHRLDKLARSQCSLLSSISPSVNFRLRGWIDSLLKGCSAGNAFIRCSALGGLLQGVSKGIVGEENYSPSLTGSIERELAVTMVEMLDGTRQSPWGSEYLSNFASGTWPPALVI